MIKPAEYPLSWPEGCERTAAADRKSSRFKVQIATALKNVRKSLNGFERDTDMKLSGIVISSNATLCNHNPEDPGVAVWFVWDDAYRCFAVDLYRTIAENLQAIHHVIEADRTKLRHAGIAFFRATFRPSAEVKMITGPRSWREILAIKDGPVTVDRVNAAYRIVARRVGAADNVAILELNLARDEALAEVNKTK
jgi:hypothetical protein